MPSAFRRQVYLYMGWFSFALGIVGGFIPLMPTTVFWIIAVWFWSKSSPELVQNIYAHPFFGAGVRNFIEHGCIRRRGKALAIGGMLVGYALFYWLAQPVGWSVWLTAAVLLAVAMWLGSLPEHVRTGQPAGQE